MYCVFFPKDKKLLELKLRRIASNPPNFLGHLAPIVQTLDSAIHRINHYVVDKYLFMRKTNCIIHCIGIYPVDSVIHLFDQLAPACVISVQVLTHPSSSLFGSHARRTEREKRDQREREG